MGAMKIRGTKRVVFGEEEVVGALERFQDFLERNRMWSYGALVVLILCVAGFWGFRSYAESRERRAAETYARISVTFPDDEQGDAGKWAALVPELEKFVSEHSDSPVRINAWMDLAKACFNLRRYDKAAEAASRAVEESGPRSPLFGLARYQLALIYQEMGKVDEALAQWTALKGDSIKGFGREIEWRLAQLHEKKGDYTRATEQYEAALKAPGSYPPAPLLSEQLASLKTKTPTPSFPSPQTPAAEVADKPRS